MRSAGPRGRAQVLGRQERLAGDEGRRQTCYDAGIMKKDTGIIPVSGRYRYDTPRISILEAAKKILQNPLIILHRHICHLSRYSIMKRASAQAMITDFAHSHISALQHHEARQRRRLAEPFHRGALIVLSVFRPRNTKVGFADLFSAATSRG